METINIIFSSDDNYAPHTGVAICSIFENRKSPSPIDIYILDGGISTRNKEKLELLSRKYNFKINFIEIDKSKFENFRISRHLTHAAYYRIIIPNLLPNLRKALYLDCDIVVLGDIFELYSINIDNYLCAAINGTSDKERNPTERLERLNIPINKKYFNSGVLLMNLDKWRKENISNKVVDFIINNKEKFETNYFNFHDQDALNAVLWNDWLDIPKKYNYMEIVFFDRFSIKTLSEIKKKNILIVHYIGTIKPWSYLSINRLDKYYFYYLKKTPWKDDIKIINKNFKNIFVSKPMIRSTDFTKKIIRSFLPIQALEFLVKIKKKLKIKLY